MSGPAITTDVEFLQLPQLDQNSYLYLYRKESALFRTAVRTKIVSHAEQEGRRLRDIAKSSIGVRLDEAQSPEATADTQPKFVPSLHATVSEVSLFDEPTLHVRDLGDPTLEHPPLEDIARALGAIAAGGEQHSIFLLVPDIHKLVETDAWRVAVDAIGLIEEPLVTAETYLAIARRYLRKSRLGDLSALADNKRFQSRLRRCFERRALTPFEFSMQIDLIVLGEMEGGEFRQIEDADARRVERWVVPETLRRFLDRRDAPSLSALMKVVDGLRHDRMLETDKLLTRLYRATTGTLESRDRRYRRLEDPLHCAWAAQLLASENQFIKGSAFVALDDVCQRYGRVDSAADWISSDDGWRMLASVFGRHSPAKPGRLDRSRIGLQSALRERLRLMSDGHIDWLELGFEAGSECIEIRTSNELSASVVEGMR
jgi:hypothetical protein